MSSPFFSDALKPFIGYSVGVFSNDGTLIKGTLVEVKNDYLILQTTEEQYIYHHLGQIKSVSKNAKDMQVNKTEKDYLQAEKLHEILEQCKYSWITVNCYNDQFVTGLLSRVFDDHLILISGEEKIIVQNACIINVFPGVHELADNEEPDGQEEKDPVVQVEAKDEPEEEALSRAGEEPGVQEEKEPVVHIEERNESEENAFWMAGEEPVEQEEKDPVAHVEAKDEPEEEGLWKTGEETDVQEEKDPAAHVEAKDEPEEGLWKTGEESDVQEEKDPAAHVEAKDEPEEEGLWKTGEETDVQEEKDPVAYVEAKDELEEILWDIVGNLGRQKERELQGPLGAKEEWNENEAAFEGKQEIEVKEKDHSNQMKQIKNPTKHHIISEADNDLVTRGKTVSDVFMDEKEGDSTRHHRERSSFKQGHAQKSWSRKKTKTNKAEKETCTDLRLDEASLPIPLEVMTEETKECWTPVITIEETELQLESQYYSLMKQAEKQYKMLRERRIEREIMNK